MSGDQLLLTILLTVPKADLLVERDHLRRNSVNHSVNQRCGKRNETVKFGDEKRFAANGRKPLFLSGEGGIRTLGTR